MHVFKNQPYKFLKKKRKIILKNNGQGMVSAMLDFGPLKMHQIKLKTNPINVQTNTTKPE